MATRRTQYIVGTRSVEGLGRDARAYWTWIDRDYGRGCDWAWTGDRKAATRFVGRAEARELADRCVAWMAAQGYPGVVLHVVPATGGVPIGAPIFDRSLG